MNAKLLFIGPEKIHQGFENLDDNWDMQVPLNDLTEFEEAVMQDEAESGISPDTSVIIILSRLFQDDPEQFARVVANYAAYTCVIILVPSIDKGKVAQIEETVKDYQKRLAEKDPDYQAQTPFFFADYNEAPSSIYRAIKNFLASGYIAPSIKASVKASMGSFGEDDPDDNTQEIEEVKHAVNILDTPSGGREGKIIAVTSYKGGSGKSTVSTLLASYIAKSSKLAVERKLADEPLKVCLVDIDTKNGQIGFLLGITAPTIVEMFISGAPTVQNLKKSLIYSQALGCDLILAAKYSMAAKRIPVAYYAQLLNLLRQEYDVVILDTSTSYTEELLLDLVYPTADYIVVVSEMVVTSIEGCAKWIKEVLLSELGHSNNIDSEKVCIVINKAMQDIGMTADHIRAATRDLPVVSMIPAAPKTIAYTSNTRDISRALNEEGINKAIYQIVTCLIDDVPLPELPYIAK